MTRMIRTILLITHAVIQMVIDELDERIRNENKLENSGKDSFPRSRSSDDDNSEERQW